MLLVVGTALGVGEHASAARQDRPARSLPLTRVTDLRLPGNPTRFDYQSVDPTGRRLYLAHLGDSTLVVVDLDALRIVATVPDLASVHGVTLAPDLGRVYATATGVDQLVGIETTTNRLVSRTATGNFPDGVAYDQQDRRLFVSDKNDGAITVIDATTNTRLATIPLAHETGNVADDPTAHSVYVAARTPDELVKIDPSTLEPVRRIRLPGCDGAHGVYLDVANQRAFVACERNARLVAVDLLRGRELARAPVGTGPDVLAFDAALHRLYVASESGTVTAFDTSRTLHKIGQSHLASGAHSVAVDQATHWVYFPLPDVGGDPALRVMQPR